MKKHKIDIIHCRSYIPAIIAYIIKKFLNIKYIFDIRGFWFDEKKDAKLILEKLYFFLKIFEKKIYRNADFIITLSRSSINYISKHLKVKREKIEYISCFTNLNNFKKNSKKIKKNIIFGYIGNVGLSYEFFKVIKFLNLFNRVNKNWKLIFANNYLKKSEKQKLFKNFQFKKKIQFLNIDFEKIGKIYNKINYGIYFLRKDFSKIASCPTKLGEMLASSTPVITNSKIGDIELYLTKSGNCGYLLNTLTPEKIKKLNKSLINNKKYYELKKNSRYVACKYFDQTKEINKYKKIYKRI